MSDFLKYSLKIKYSVQAHITCSLYRMIQYYKNVNCSQNTLVGCMHFKMCWIDFQWHKPPDLMGIDLL